MFDRTELTTLATFDVFKLSIVSYLSKVANFNLPHLHLALPLGVTQYEFCRDLQQQKTRLPGLSCGVVCVILCLAVSVEHRLIITLLKVEGVTCPNAP